MASLTMVVCCDVVFVAGWLLASFATTPKRVVSDRPTLEVAWRVSGEARGTPAVAGDTVYFLSKHHDVVAIQRDTGQVIWTRPTGEPGPATGGSRVLATSDVVVAGDYNLVAFERDGRPRWRFVPADGYGPGPYLGAADEERVYAGSPTGWVYGVELGTGRARWSARVSGTDESPAFAPVVDRDVVIVGIAGQRGGGLISLDAATGRERWRTTFVGRRPGAVGFGGGPLVVGDAVVAAATDGWIHVLDRTTGRPRWNWPALPSGVAGTPMVQDYRPLARSGRFLMAGSLSGTVVAYDLATGRERWRRTPQRSSIAFGLASDARSVYVPYLSGPLVALDVRDGRERGRSPESTVGFSWVPTADGSRVFAASSTDGYFAFRTPSR